MTFSGDLGKKGEDLAVKILQEQGYKIIQKNFRSHFGEIDIIAIDGETLVFVEVKTRWSKNYGLPEEAITPWKIRRMIKASQYFQLINSNLPKLLRLDAVLINLSPTGEIGETRIIKNLTG